MEITLKIKFVVSSNTLELKNLESFNAGVSVRNFGEKEEYFNISETILFVNSRRSKAWDLAVQNGTIINFRIPPKKTKTVEWPLGRALFVTPGTYKLELHWREYIHKCEVRVTG